MTIIRFGHLTVIVAINCNSRNITGRIVYHLQWRRLHFGSIVAKIRILFSRSTRMILNWKVEWKWKKKKNKTDAKCKSNEPWGTERQVARVSYCPTKWVRLLEKYFINKFRPPLLGGIGYRWNFVAWFWLLLYTDEKSGWDCLVAAAAATYDTHSILFMILVWSSFFCFWRETV